ncbi:MAG: Thiosulfate sulfurtransferase [Candidatus Heimdallarchaeota archaeon LC_2]|nr:MAG: Thiosulfate sulfurtransferase [Candidatus Heimdallarchaeota archaeon LC_2]
MIISVEELKRVMGEHDIVLVDCFSNEHQYLRAHIPSAIKLHGNPDMKAGDKDNPGILYPEANEFEKIMYEMGIGANTTVVAYDNDGSLFASRFLWGLMYYGHNKVKLLDGGWRAWINLGNPVSIDFHQPKENPTKFQSKINHDLVISKDSLLRNLGNSNTKIIDTRTLDEYQGKDARGNMRSGKVPGAIHIEWTQMLSGSNPKAEVSFFKPNSEIEEMFKNAEIDKKNHIVPYCQGAVRACLTAYALVNAGYDNISVYDGSMKEWANDPLTPLE